VGVRPPGPPTGVAVSPQSSKDKRAKRSPVGFPMEKEGRAISALGRIRSANKPGPPEHSVLLRAASAAAVAVGIAACAAEGELSVPVAAVSITAVAAGNLFSYRRRARPLPWLKLVLAVVAVLAFWRFFFAISAANGVTNLGAVEGPLAVLFTWIQVTHAFDVPSRKDLTFSLAGSVTLMAAAAAQAVDMTFALYVVAWAACMLAGLAAMWGSIGGSGAPRARALLIAAGALLVVALGAVVILPPPSVSSRLVFPSALSGDVAIGSPAGLEGTAAGATLPDRAGSPTGRIAVGGYLGFAGPLDTAVRGALGDQLVFRVRADHPTFWLAETFDHWDGQSWTEAQPVRRSGWRELAGPSPFGIPTVGEPAGTEDIQTFYLAQPGPNLVFHAEAATQVWFPADHLYVNPDGSIRSGTSMGAGSIYTVVSTIASPSTAELAGARGQPLDAADLARFTELPHPYRRVAALAARVTAHATSTEAKVLALEGWLARHTRYTTDIPPLPPGADTVDEFLFGNRRGFCEQISTALAVMLRTLGIPAREATGYVPGPYNPITDLYQVQAKDAHAWVQVWFPGFGWQSFDPTASVPAATPSAAATLGREALHALRRVPPAALAALLASAVVGGLVLRLRGRRRAGAPGTVHRALLTTARRRGVATAPSESLARLGARLDAHTPPPPGAPGAAALAGVAEECAFGGRVLDQAGRRALERAARALARRSRSPARRRRPVSPTGGPPPGPRRTRRPAGAAAAGPSAGGAG